jgi:hypothetical protein
VGAVITPPDNMQLVHVLSDVTVTLAGAAVNIGQEDSSTLERNASPPPPPYVLSAPPVMVIELAN